MPRPTRPPARPLVALAFAFGTALLPAGCGSGSNGGTSPEVAQSQRSASDAWQKAKADGTDKRKHSGPIGQVGNNRGSANH